MAALASAIAPVQPERLRRDTDDVPIEIERADTIALQPGLVTHMVAGCHRPPPPGEMTEPTRPAERPHRRGLLQRQVTALPQPHESIPAHCIAQPQREPEIVGRNTIQRQHSVAHLISARSAVPPQPVAIGQARKGIPQRHDTTVHEPTPTSRRLQTEQTVLAETRE
jgi:hypothetical protein